MLINNAGAMFGSRQLTSDGLEDTFALNYVAYFLVTEGLRERLLASAPARVVNTASGAHRGARLDFDDLQLAKDFSAMKAYRRSKLCNILFTRELARRLHGTRVTANCVRPGFVATRFGNQSGGMIRASSGSPSFSPCLQKRARKRLSISLLNRMWLKRLARIYKCLPIQPSQEAEDDKAASLLWQRTADLAGLKA